MNENNEVNGVEHSVATIAGQIRNENGQVVSEVARWGIRIKDGLPKQKPGRKATGSVNKTKNIFVYRGQVVSRGKPSLEQVKHRRRVTIPVGVKYDAAVHGVGERLPEDDQRVVEWEAEIANRELARKAAKVAAQTASPEVSPTAPNNDTVSL